MSALADSNLPAADWYLEIIGCTIEAIFVMCWKFVDVY